MMKVMVGLAVVLASHPALADDTLRTTATREARSQLERYTEGLAFVRNADSATVADIVDDLEAIPDDAMLRAYLASNPARAVVWDVDATLGSGTASGDLVGELTAAATARVIGDYCDVAQAGVALRGTAGADLSSIEGRLHGSVCLWRGISGAPSPGRKASGSLFPLRASGELVLNVAPRFTAARNEPRLRYSAAKLAIAFESIRISPSNPATGGAFLYMDIAETWEWLDLADGGHGYRFDGRFGFFRFFRTRDPDGLGDRAIDVIDIDSRGIRNELDKAVVLVDVYPVRLRGIGLGSDHILLDAEVGLATSGGMITSSTCVNDVCNTEEIVGGKDVPTLETWAARVSLAVGTRERAAGLDVHRDLDGNVLGQLTLERRATAWTQLVRGRTTLRAEAFTGAATHYLDLTTRGDERFTGAAIDTRVTVSPSLWAGLQVDGIATYDRDPLLTGRIAGSGIRAFATLGYHRELKRRRIALRLPE